MLITESQFITHCFVSLFLTDEDSSDGVGRRMRRLSPWVEFGVQRRVEVLGTSVPRAADLLLERNVIAGGGNRLVLRLSSDGMAGRTAVLVRLARETVFQPPPLSYHAGI